MDKPLVVTLDIETAPIEALTWGIHDQNVSLEQIQKDWSILSFSYKVLGEKKVYYFDTGGRGAAKVRDDSVLLKKLWDVLDAADILVVQNGQAFDLPRINARLLESGFKPYSPVRVIDTLLVARKRFGFTSNKLAWLSRLVAKKKSEHKKFPGFSLWLACLRDEKAAWREMKHYNARDVESTELLYLKLRPWIEGHINIAAYSDSEEPACPKCGSQRLRPNGRAYTQTGYHQRYVCLGCGGYCKSRRNAVSAAKRKSMLGS